MAIIWLLIAVLSGASNNQGSAGNEKPDKKKPELSGKEKMKAYEAGQAYAQKAQKMEDATPLLGTVFAVIERDDGTSVLFNSDEKNAEIKKAFESGEKNYRDLK